MEQKAPLTQTSCYSSLLGSQEHPSGNISDGRYGPLYKFLPSSLFLSPSLDQGDTEIFGSM